VLPQGYEKARINIMSIWGQQVRPVVQSNGLTRTIDLQELPAATYMLQIINGNEIKSFKVVKQ
jgi:hypothetical protein